MQVVLLLLRLGLAGVFVVAAVGKFADRQGSLQALEAIRRPGEAARCRELDAAGG